MTIHVDGRALRNRRDEMCRSADSLDTSPASDGATTSLLLFYAAECGLKERALSRGNHRDTSGLTLTHDLRQIAKDLRLSPTMSKHLKCLEKCHRAKPATRLAIHELHEAWRYGAKLSKEDQKKAQVALRELINWCRTDI